MVDLQFGVLLFDCKHTCKSECFGYCSFVEVLDMTQKVEPTCAACIDGASDIESHIFPEGCCSEVKILD